MFKKGLRFLGVMVFVIVIAVAMVLICFFGYRQIADAETSPAHELIELRNLKDCAFKMVFSSPDVTSLPSVVFDWTDKTITVDSAGMNFAAHGGLFSVGLFCFSIPYYDLTATQAENFDFTVYSLFSCGVSSVTGGSLQGVNTFSLNNPSFHPDVSPIPFTLPGFYLDNPSTPLLLSLSYAKDSYSSQTMVLFEFDFSSDFFPVNTGAELVNLFNPEILESYKDGEYFTLVSSCVDGDGFAFSCEELSFLKQGQLVGELPQFFNDTYFYFFEVDIPKSYTFSLGVYNNSAARWVNKIDFTVKLSAGLYSFSCVYPFIGRGSPLRIKNVMFCSTFSKQMPEYVPYIPNYDAGKSEGYEQGKTEGYQSGHSAGYDSGKTDGYGQGKTDGYNEGYRVGDSDATNAWNGLLPSAFGGVVNFFKELGGIKVWGTTIGDLIASIGAVLLVVFIIRLGFK